MCTLAWYSATSRFASPLFGEVRRNSASRSFFPVSALNSGRSSEGPRQERRHVWRDDVPDRGGRVQLAQIVDEREHLRDRDDP
jgi:hypothetical protein